MAATPPDCSSAKNAPSVKFCTKNAERGRSDAGEPSAREFGSARAPPPPRAREQHKAAAPRRRRGACEPAKRSVRRRERQVRRANATYAASALRGDPPPSVAVIPVERRSAVRVATPIGYATSGQALGDAAAGLAGAADDEDGHPTQPGGLRWTQMLVRLIDICDRLTMTAVDALPHPSGIACSRPCSRTPGRSPSEPCPVDRGWHGPRRSDLHGAAAATRIAERDVILARSRGLPRRRLARHSRRHQDPAGPGVHRSDRRDPHRVDVSQRPHLGQHPVPRCRRS